MRNIWIGIILIVILAIVGFVFLGKQNSNQQTAAPSTQISQSTSVPESASPSSSVSEQNLITLTSDGFTPSTLTIKAGDKVTWVNKSGTDAAINSAPHPVHTDYPPLNLGNFPDNGTLSLAFPKAGTYKYHNHLNPGQTGTIVVQ